MVNKMLIVLPCMLLFNQLDQTDEVLMGLFRLAFFTYSAIAAGCFWLAQQRISEANDQRKFWVKPAGAFFQVRVCVCACCKTTAPGVGPVLPAAAAFVWHQASLQGDDIVRAHIRVCLHVTRQSNLR
jgi:hypothetical protein